MRQLILYTYAPGHRGAQQCQEIQGADHCGALFSMVEVAWS